MRLDGMRLVCRLICRLTTWAPACVARMFRRKEAAKSEIMRLSRALTRRPAVGPRSAIRGAFGCLMSAMRPDTSWTEPAAGC